MMLSGLIKSTVGTLLMSLGTTISVYSFVQPGVYAWHTPLIGVVLICLGVFVYFIGDIYKVIQKRREEERLKQEYLERLEKLENNLCEDINRLTSCQGVGDGFCQKHKKEEDDD